MIKPCVICGIDLDVQGRDVTCSELCNIIQVRKMKTEWRNNHKEELNDYRRNNKHYKSLRKGYNREHRLHSKEKINEDRRKRMKDISFRIACRLRGRVYMALKGNIKRGKTIELLGCDIPTLKQHLASKFTEGMSFENYGAWHIDHIIPCASFDLTKEEEQKKCLHYTNLQPLWAVDNIRKH